jgi:BolA protein
MDVKARITQALQELAPLELQVIDESEAHRGHSGFSEGTVTHLRVILRAKAFEGRSRLERHRLVNALLAPEFARGLHALALVAKAPGEP